MEDCDTQLFYYLSYYLLLISLLFRLVCQGISVINQLVNGLIKEKKRKRIINIDFAVRAS